MLSGSRSVPLETASPGDSSGSRLFYPSAGFMQTSLDPKRTVAELKELRRLTADENGAQRVAFTKTWVATRAWLKKKLEPLPVESHADAAGNLWTTLRGQSERALLIGGHMDSVPNGGWL